MRGWSFTDALLLHFPPLLQEHAGGCRRVAGSYGLAFERMALGNG